MFRAPDPTVKHVTAAEMCRIDERAIIEFGIPSLILMENAGAACARETLELIRKKKARVAIFAGKGNNGGDGFVAARHLANRGFEPEVFYFQAPEEMKADPLVNFKILEQMKVALVDCSKGLPAARIQKSLKKSAAVLDALFGTGLSKPVEERFKLAIEMINASGRPVLAVDIPSGLNADTGEVMGACVRADVTVTLELPKKGFLKRAARKFTGRVVEADISIPKILLK